MSDELLTLVGYRQAAQAALAEYRQAQAERERADAERQARELAEQWALVKAHLAEMVPEPLLPLIRLDESEAPRNNVGVWFYEGEYVILRLYVYVQANLEISFEQLVVPDVVILDGSEGWKACFMHDRYYGSIKRVEGFYSTNPQHWPLAVARAYEQLEAWRAFDAEAQAHNAEVAERATEDEIIAQVYGDKDEPEVRTFFVVQDGHLATFANSVEAFLAEGWTLHGPTQVVMQQNPEYADAVIPVFYQALVRDAAEAF